MTTTAIRKKVHQYVDEAEDKVLEAMYGMLKIYVDAGEESMMSKEQKNEIDKRSKLFRQGKLKTSTWEEVKKRTRLAQ
ncbi:MAG: addiction module protein [Bacteroidetes bacterium]|nr:addiction module protein [Bacteroidota bacterium]